MPFGDGPHRTNPRRRFKEEYALQLRYSDPTLCPTCGEPAQVVVGARGYCRADADAMRAFLEKRDVAEALIEFIEEHAA